MDLLRDKDGAYFRWSHLYWSVVLELAERYGLKPEGTESPQIVEYDHVVWKGSYNANSGQTVTGKDAKAMAAALETGIIGIDRNIG